MPLRSTRIRSIATDDPDPAILEEAAQILRDGGLVAFATETVYGLGADATNPEAVARIFEAKGRPPTNPLIVHASCPDMARSCVAEWPEAAEDLARHFWPGPLTIVLRRSEIIPNLVTAGLPTVGVRVPRPAVARRLIAAAGRPIAAPSANRSCGISPTLAGHVAKDLGGKIEMILDSGQTSMGLESTVVDLTTRPPRILRHGPITAEELEHRIGPVRVQESGRDASDSPRTSPGQMAVHYAPRTHAIQVDRIEDLARWPWPHEGGAALIVIGPHDLPAVPVPSACRFDLPTPAIAEHDLYVVLHRCDAMNLERIVIVPPPDRPEWRAVRDRIARATT